MEILNLLAPMAFGGVAGQVLAEVLRRRRARVQTVALIERVNRQVSPKLQGITLARVTTIQQRRQLEEITDLREYQLTLRNTSNLHFRDVEIQFEFPTEDVQSWTSRPVRSQTALVPIEVIANQPWKKAFRWRIPHLPADDSVEFTFQAVAPDSDEYISALYNSDGAVIERVTSEPRRRLSPVGVALRLTWWLTMVGALVFMGYQIFRLIDLNSVATRNDLSATLAGSGCNLFISSSFDPDVQFKGRVWQVHYKVLNGGDKMCHVSWPNAFAQREISPSQYEFSDRPLTHLPSPTKVTVSFYAAGEKPTQLETNSY